MGWFDDDFLDDLSDLILAAGKKVANTAKTAADKARAGVNLAQEEKKLRKAYRALGQYVYDQSGLNPDGPMAELYAVIAEAKANIEALKAEGAETEAADDEEETEEAEEVEEVPTEDDYSDAEGVLCPACGASVDAGQEKCPCCGGKLH